MIITDMEDSNAYVNYNPRGRGPLALTYDADQLPEIHLMRTKAKLQQLQRVPRHQMVCLSAERGLYI